MNVAYVRVSTAEQNEARQVEQLRDYGIDKWFIEKISGKDVNRPAFQSMIEFVREGDCVYVLDWSRLSRSVTDLLTTIETLDRKNVKLISIKENFDTNTPTGKLMLHIISGINEFERANILERQREGIAVAKKNGVYKGRKLNKYDENLLREIMVGIEGKTMTVSEAARRLGVTRATVYNLLKRNCNDVV